MPESKTSGDAARQHKQRLRKRLLAIRRDLSPAQRQCASDGVAARIIHSTCFHEARNVAGYLAMPSEIDIERVLHAALSTGKSVWVPRLRSGAMDFARWTGESVTGATMGLREPPPPHELIDPRLLDLVLVPLVGYTADGDRLGMGGGYYDRTFAFRGKSRAPLLLGVAHPCQQLDQLPTDPWDVSLDGVVTHEQWLSCSPDPAPAGSPSSKE